MRKSSGWQKFSSQGLYTRILLANYESPCYRLHQEVRSLPTTSLVSRMPTQDQATITSPWPSAQWGIDIVGLLPTAPAQKKLLVAIDYFSKRIKAEAFASIKDKDVVQFMWKNIVCRFGIPQSILTDNGPQFDNGVYRNFF